MKGNNTDWLLEGYAIYDFWRFLLGAQHAPERPRFLPGWAVIDAVSYTVVAQFKLQYLAHN